MEHIYTSSRNHNTKAFLDMIFFPYVAIRYNVLVDIQHFYQIQGFSGIIILPI